MKHFGNRAKLNYKFDERNAGILPAQRPTGCSKSLRFGTFRLLAQSVLAGCQRSIYKSILPNYLAFITLLILSFALIVFAQKPTPTPPNNDDAVVKSQPH